MQLTKQFNSYQKLLSLGLSADETPETLQKIKQLFSELDEDKVFEMANTDEVATHLAYKVKKYNGVLSDKWDKEYIEVDARIKTY